MALRTDIFLHPELVPEYNRVETSFPKTFTVKGAADVSHREDGILIYLFVTIVITLPLIIFLYGSALIYRYSLKTSSIIYFPLIYISGGFIKGVPAIELNSIRTGPIQRFSLYYALFALVFLTVVPILAYSNLVELRTGFEQQYSFANEPWFRDLVGYWIYAYEWKPLYAARAISAALTVALFFYADWEIRNRKFGAGRSDRGVRTWLGAMKLPRFVCVAYTTGFGLFTVVPYIDLPPFVWDWWPA